MSTLVLGLGNPYARDDAAGLRLAAAAQERWASWPGLSWLPDCSTGGLDLLPLLTGHSRLVLFDSIRTAEGRPGDWHRFTAADLRETRHLDSIHDLNFATALELGRALGMDLPADREIHIFAVEIEENDEFGEEFSPSLAAVWPRLCRELLAEAAGLLHEVEPAKE